MMAKEIEEEVYGVPDAGEEAPLHWALSLQTSNWIKGRLE